MKKIAGLCFVLLSTLLPAQHQKCKVLEEKLPELYVEPTTDNGRSYCPRADYKLDWYVVPDTEFVTYISSSGWGSISYYGCNSSGTCGSIKQDQKKILKFKPVCVPVEVTGIYFTPASTTLINPVSGTLTTGTPEKK